MGMYLVITVGLALSLPVVAGNGLILLQTILVLVAKVRFTP